MYLLLGHATDPCCTGVAARLETRGLRARIVDAPLAPPAMLTWRLDVTGVTSRLANDAPNRAIAGVLVRDTAWLDPAGWDKDDHAYMQAELRAVMLAWLAGLACPVINPPSAALWYRAAAPLLSWRPLLRRSGLPLPEVVITNDPSEATAFRHRLAESGVNGAVYSPMTGAGRYLLDGDDAWDRIATVQHKTTVCLTEPHGATSLACVVGDDVIWNGAVSPDARALEPAIRRFAAAAGLTFVEIALAPVRRGLAVVLVDPRPRLEQFDESSRQMILDALVTLLTQSRVVEPDAPLVRS
jgi:hypothetical protein